MSDAVSESDPLLERIRERFGGRLEIGARLGEGAMGSVHRVELDGKSYALKVLLPAALSSPDLLRRFLLEGRILRELDHPNVLRVFEVGEDPACPFLLCELVEGVGLDRVVAGGPLPWQRALTLTEGMLAGLAHAHTRGIVHRDVKPANVLLDSEDRPRVADFGIAKVAGLEAHRTATGIVMGTPAYIAPELVLGEVPSQASDVYSAGVVLFELVTGRPPFEGDEVSTLLAMKVKTHIVPLASRAAADVPVAVDRLITMAMAREPGERLPTAAAFARELADTRRMILTTPRGATAAIRATSGVRTTAAVRTTSGVSSTSRIPQAAPPPPEPVRGVRAWATGALVASLALALVWAFPWHRFPAPRARESAAARAGAPVAPLTAAEQALRDALVEGRSGSAELDRRLAQATALEPARAAAVLHEAWRRSAEGLRVKIGEQLAELNDARAVPPLLEALLAPGAGDEPRRAAAARRLSALVATADAPDAAACPDPEVAASQACTLLKRACAPGAGESPDAVRAAVRCLGWLGHPDTACIEDVVRAPGCVGWVGDGFADDPARETRAALAKIDSRAARRQLEELPPLTTAPLH